MGRIDAQIIFNYLKLFSKDINATFLGNNLYVSMSTAQRLLYRMHKIKSVTCYFWVDTNRWKSNREYNSENGCESSIPLSKSFDEQVISVFEFCFQKFLNSDLNAAKVMLENHLRKENIPKEIRDELLSQPDFKSIAKSLEYSARRCKNLPIEDSEESADEDGENTIELKTVQDMAKLGWSEFDISKNLIENDAALFNGVLQPENAGTSEQWATFIRKFPETFRFLYDSGRKMIIGNWSMAALTDIQAEKVIAGEFAESEMDLENSGVINQRGIHTLYILNYSINPDIRLNYDSLQNNILLQDSLFEQIENYGRSGIFFKQILVNCFLPEHKGFYQGLGFKETAQNNFSGTIFALQMVPFPKQLKPYTELRILYEEKFNPF